MKHKINIEKRGKPIISRSNNRLTIGIPANKNWMVIFLLSAWLAIWWLGEVGAFQKIMAGFRYDTAKVFLLLWTAGWTITGIFALITVLWQAFGREYISIENNVLSFRRMILGFGRTVRFDVSEIKNLRVNPNIKEGFEAFSSSINLKHIPWGMKDGSIQFTYGTKQYSFAAGVNKLDASHMLEVLKTYPLLSETSVSS